MLVHVLKSKIKKAVITDSNKKYRGSITIDEDLMDEANLREWEKVEVNGRDRKVRIKTYVIKGERGSGCIEANGGLAQYFQKGDIVHILSYGIISEDTDYEPIIV